MPLKHFTETFLVVTLGVAIALTGLLVSTLPPLPDSALPWAVLFVLSIIYPISLQSLFQRRRADNFFRNLHWLPAAILFGWLILQVIAITTSLTYEKMWFYTWGFALVPVLLGFILLVSFCLKVIRRRVPRLTFLALVLVPFTALALFSEQGGDFEKELAAVLWQADFWTVEETKFLTAWMDTKTQSGKNVEVSSDPSEEKWREQLRQQQEREKEIAMRASSDSSSSVSSSVPSSYSSSSQLTIASVSSRPSTLPDSGLSWTLIISLLIIGYSATVHARSVKRVESLELRV